MLDLRYVIKTNHITVYFFKLAGLKNKLVAGPVGHAIYK